MPNKTIPNYIILIKKIDRLFVRCCLYDTLVFHETTCRLPLKLSRHDGDWFGIIKKRAKTFEFSFVLINVSLLARIFHENYKCPVTEIAG